MGLDDYILMLSFLITVVLVVQTTWAIVDEGQGKHIDKESRTEFAKVAHVSKSAYCEDSNPLTQHRLISLSLLMKICGVSSTRSSELLLHFIFAKYLA